MLPESGQMKLSCVRSCSAVLLFVSAFFLSGCAGLRPVPEAPIPSRETLDAFSLEGRFSLRHEDKNYSGRLSWRHAGASNELLLASPFGQGIAQITTSASEARLTMSDGQEYSADNAETLTRQVLGYPLPLAQLTDWVRGRGAEAGTRDERGRLSRLQHEGWSIDYGYDGDDPLAPPSRIFAERTGGIELRLRIDEWSSLSSGDGAP